MTLNLYSFVIVTPVYEETEATLKVFEQLYQLYGKKIKLVVVDDGSVHSPFLMKHIEQSGLDGVLITLRRNLGHQRAIAVGLSYVAEHLPRVQQIIVMDSDGEDIPSSIEILRTALAQPNTDIAVAVRKSRVGTVKFKIFYAIYKWLFARLTGHVINFGNFMAMKQSALKRIVSMPDLWIHVAGCALNSKLRIKNCLIDRGPRYSGDSKMNFVSLMLHGFKGIMVFAEDVLVRVGLACALAAVLSVLAGGLAIGLKILGIATPGWFSVSLGILVLVFLQTGVLTLMSLMLTGVVKGWSTLVNADYRTTIGKIEISSAQVEIYEFRS